MNSCNFIGNLTRDPELRYIPSGKAVVEFGIAVNRKVKDEEQVSFFDMVAWERTAEVISEYLKKGDKVALSNCEARQETWEKDGQKRSKVVFNVGKMEMLSSKRSAGTPETEPNTDVESQPRPTKTPKKNAKAESFDEIPF
jgi:single-strand DNA-binding protein